jgi:hypothetical protein
MQVFKRTFEAGKHPEGSLERERLAGSKLTNLDYPTYKFVVLDEDGYVREIFRTEQEAERWAREHEL